MNDTAKSLQKQTDELQQAIATLEAQRAVLGNAVVDAAQTSMRQTLAELRAATNEQRKLVSVLFADLVGFTALSERLDPEDVRELQQAYFAGWREAIERHGGVVEKFIGDAVMALFGVPTAREDDAERAVRAGLALQAALADLNVDRGVKLQMRAGVHTGLVVVSGAPGDFVATGDTVNIAARLQAHAPPGGVLISRDTHQQVRGLFDAIALPPLSLKGKVAPLLTFLVQRPLTSATRTMARGIEGVETRMVGREAELTTLQKAHADVVADQSARLAIVVGEPGLGKSRLAYEFSRWLLDQQDQPIVLRARAAPQSSTTPAAVLRNLFSQHFSIDETDSAAAVAAKFRAGTSGHLQPDEADILGQFCGFDFSASAAVRRLLGQDALGNLGREYLARYLEQLGQARPVVWVAEDLHWADDRSLDALLALVAPRPLAIPLLIIGLTRPYFFERRPHWGEGLDSVTRLELKPLSRRESRDLVSEILQKAQHLPGSLRDLIASSSEGNPYFAEELVKMLVDDGVIVDVPGSQAWRVNTDRMAAVRVPATLAGVLQARLDSLPPLERETLQRAAVVGREFWDEAVARLGDAQDDARQALDPILQTLRRRELVYRHEHSAFAQTAEFAFKHALLRDVTYETVLRRLRRTYHRQVAEWMEQRAGDRLPEYAGLIAYHYQHAEAPQQTLKYLTLAAETALTRYANAEAAAYYQQALELNPEDSARARLLDGLGRALDRQADFAAAVSTWRQAIALYHTLGDTDRAARLYARSGRALWYMQDTPGNLAIAQAGLHELAGAPMSPGRAALYHEAGRAAFFNGQIDEAYGMCQQALEMAEAIRAVDVEADVLATYGLLPQVSLPVRLDALGRAAALAEDAGLLGIAQRAYNNLGVVLSTQANDLTAAVRSYRRASVVARQRGAVHEEGWSLVSLEGGSCWAGDLPGAAEAIERLRRLVQVHPGSPVLKNQAMRAEADYLWHVGELERAAALFRECIAFNETTNDPQTLGYLYLSLAWVMIDLEAQDAAEAPLRRAIEVEAQQGESDISIDARLTFVDLRAGQGRVGEAEVQLREAEALAGPEPAKGRLVWLRMGTAWVARARSEWQIALLNGQLAIDEHRQAGRHWAAVSLYREMAKTHLARNAAGDRQQAQALLAQARDAFKAMGAHGRAAQADARLRTLGSTPSD